MSDICIITMLTKLSGFKLMVRANRFGCRSSLACIAHDRLAAHLDKIVADLRSDVQEEQAVLAARGTPDGDLAYEEFQERWPAPKVWVDGRPIALLDPILVPVRIEAGEMRALGRIRDASFTADELEGLAEIIADISRETGVRFVAREVREVAADGSPAIW